MAAPKGNEFWKLADPTKWGQGGERSFKSPEELWQKASEYFRWCDDNPWIITDAAKGGDRFGEHVQTPTARPYTLSGLCLFLGITQPTLTNYEKTPGNEAFFSVARAIKEIVYTQKFEGAAVGAFNANIIARDLGLIDKQEVSELKIKITRKKSDAD